MTTSTSSDGNGSHSEGERATQPNFADICSQLYWMTKMKENIVKLHTQTEQVVVQENAQDLSSARPKEQPDNSDFDSEVDK